MNEIVTQQVQPLATVEPSITAIIASAVASGRPASELTELLNFARELDKDKARKEFNSAFSAFKAEMPSIQRRHDSQFKTVDRNGVSRVRRFADLEDIAQAIDPVLARHGLSYSWGETKVDSGLMSVPCIVAHSGGHSITGSFPVPVDSKAGCSEAQKYGIAHTYARRYSLVSVLGLTSVDEDMDGADPTIKTGPHITDAQAQELNDLLIELADLRKMPHDGQIKAFKGWARIGDKPIAELPASQFDKSVATLQSQIATAKK